jgi:hypothetical protein
MLVAKLLENIQVFTCSKQESNQGVGGKDEW